MHNFCIHTGNLQKLTTFGLVGPYAMRSTRNLLMHQSRLLLVDVLCTILPPFFYKHLILRVSITSASSLSLATALHGFVAQVAYRTSKQTFCAFVYRAIVSTTASHNYNRLCSAHRRQITHTSSESWTFPPLVQRKADTFRLTSPRQLTPTLRAVPQPKSSTPGPSPT